MIVISLARFRKKPDKDMMAQADKVREQMANDGVKIVGSYWTLGRYDAVLIAEGPDEKTIMKALLRAQDLLSSETLVAVRREDAVKLVE